MSSIDVTSTQYPDRNFVYVIERYRINWTVIELIEHNQTA